MVASCLENSQRVTPYGVRFLGFPHSGKVPVQSGIKACIENRVADWSDALIRFKLLWRNLVAALVLETSPSGCQFESDEEHTMHDHKEYSKEYKKERYQKDPEFRERERRRTAANAVATRAIIIEAKNVPCMDCGIQYPYYVMQFDHVRGEKLFNIANVRTMSKKKLLDEIAKCEIVCANCHAERTYQRMILS